MANARLSSAGGIGAWTMFTYRFFKWLKSPTPYLMLVGFGLFFGAWFLLSEVFKFWRFASLPGPREVLLEFPLDALKGIVDRLDVAAEHVGDLLIRLPVHVKPQDFGFE